MKNNVEENKMDKSIVEGITSINNYLQQILYIIRKDNEM